MLVHGCKIAPELKTTVLRFQTFPGDMSPDSPTLCGSVNILTRFEPAATALLDKIVCAACASINMCDSVVYTSCFLVLSLRQSGQYQMYVVCLDVSILSETTGKCNMGCHMRHFSLVWSMAITIYSMGSTLYLHVTIF